MDPRMPTSWRRIQESQRSQRLTRHHFEATSSVMTITSHVTLPLREKPSPVADTLLEIKSRGERRGRAPSFLSTDCE